MKYEIFIIYLYNINNTRIDHTIKHERNNINSCWPSRVQLGHEVFSLFCQEHCINPDGTLPLTSELSNNDKEFTTFFNETEESRFFPRSIFIDPDPTLIDEIRTGPNQHLFNPNQFISGKQDASSNLARGYHTISKEILDLALEKIRKNLNSAHNSKDFSYITQLEVELDQA
jgi:hypothetical protein